MDLYDWPSALKARRVEFNARGRVARGPVSMTGRTQGASIDAGFWVATMSLATISGNSIKIFRQLAGLLEGGANHIRVPVFEKARAPWAYSGSTPITAVSDVTFTDGALFADGSSFYMQPITIELSDDVALRDIEIPVTVSQAGTIMGGEYFSLGGNLHVIKQVIDVDDTEQTWRVWPPMRQAWDEGTQLNFARPVCRMGLVDDGSMDLAIERFRAETTLSFVEVLP